MTTKIDRDGVCIQQTSYTCGPAAAVTGLRKLGLPAEEGQLAIWSETSSLGTTPEELENALRSHYQTNHLKVRYQKFRTVTDLKKTGVTLAVMKYDLMTDHFVAILAVTDHEVIIGDPLNGKVASSYEDFARQWRYCGLSLQLSPSPLPR